SALGLVGIALGGYHVVIAGEYHWGSVRHQLRGMTGESFEPAQLVVEPGTGSRIAVWQIETADDGLIDLGFDVAAVYILGISRQYAAGLGWLSGGGADGRGV